jgi:bacteriorhodopsin
LPALRTRTGLQSARERTRALLPLSARLQPLRFASEGSGARSTPADAPCASRRLAAAHASACNIFGATLLFTLASWAWATHPVKRAIASCICLVNAVAFATYAAHSAGYTPALQTVTPGDLMEPFRFLQWSFTTPMLIVVLGCIAGDGPVARGLLFRALAADMLMIALAFGERYAAGALRGVLFWGGGAFFWVTMRAMQRLFTLAAAAASAPEDAQSLRTLWRHTLVCWCCFPLVRALRIGGAVGPNAEEILFAVADIAAKTGYSCLLINGTFTLLDSLTQHRLARCDELMTLIRGAEDGPSRLAGSLAAAYREAGGLRPAKQRSARISSTVTEAAPCDEAAEALLAAAVSEYVALAQGRSDAWGAR